MSLHTEIRGMMPGTGYRTREVDLLSGVGWEQSDSGLFLPPKKVRHGLPVAVDLFCGAGGFGLGFHQAGYDVAVAADWEPVCALTYLTNLGSPDTLVHVGESPPPKASKKDRALFEEHGGAVVRAGDLWDDIGTGWIAAPPRDHEPGSCAGHIEGEEERAAFCEAYHADPIHRHPCEHFFLYDHTELTGGMILEALGVALGEVACVTGGPPCQGFSSLTRWRDQTKDPRNNLVFEFARIVLEIMPKAMVMENVPEILNMKTAEGLPLLDVMCRMLEEGGFSTYDALRKGLTWGLEGGARGAVRQRPGDAEREPELQQELAL